MEPQKNTVDNKYQRVSICENRAVTEAHQPVASDILIYGTKQLVKEVS